MVLFWVGWREGGGVEGGCLDAGMNGWMAG